MSSSTRSPSLVRPRAIAARVERARLWVSLEDGREIGVPVEWFAWLAAGTDAQQRDLRLVEGGAGIWWEQLEDGVSVPGLLGLQEWP